MEMIKKQKKRSKSYGKQIEENIIASLEMVCPNGVKSGPELDHNYKIDLTINLSGQVFGIQISLYQNRLKMINAKHRAMDVVSRFIYLHISSSFFSKASRHEGRELYNFLNYVSEAYTDKALLINIHFPKVKVEAI